MCNFPPFAEIGLHSPLTFITQITLASKFSAAYFAFPFPVCLFEVSCKVSIFCLGAETQQAILGFVSPGELPSNPLGDFYLWICALAAGHSGSVRSLQATQDQCARCKAQRRIGESIAKPCGSSCLGLRVHKSG